MAWAEGPGYAEMPSGELVGLSIDSINQYSRGLGYGQEIEVNVRLYGALELREEAIRALGDQFVEQLAGMFGVPLTITREEVTGSKPKPKKKRTSGAKRRKKSSGNNTKPKPPADLPPGQRAIEY